METKRFEGQRLNDTLFKNCAMAGSRFEDVDLAGAQYSDVNLRGSRLVNVNLSGASIDDANIDGLTIMGADVQSLLRRSGARAMAAEPQLFVSSIDEACRFYLGKLGFRVIFSWQEPAFYAQIARDGWRLNLRAVHGPVFDRGFREREADALSATLVVDDARPFFREFEEAGATFHQPLKTEAWGATTFILSDPDGNLIAVAAR